MNRYHVWIPRKTPALTYAARELARAGISFAPSQEEANVILLPVPTPKEAASGGLPGQLTVGGNLETGLDLLKDPRFLAENAAVTAEAALQILMEALPCRIRGCKILLLGWGRIGACLGKLLDALGADLAVYDRKEEKCALINAMGISASDAVPDPKKFRVIVNTIPAAVLPENAGFRPDAVKIDLASGIFLPGEGVISARGLPGKRKPEAAGRLIAERLLDFLKGGGFL